MRYGRLIFGFLIVLAALWIVVGEQITGASSDAVVNARLTTVRSPIAGTVEMPFRPFGTRVETGESLATVSDPLVDTIRLNDLGLERAFLSAAIDRVSSEIGGATQEIEFLSARNAIYADHRADEIAVMLNRSQERVRLLEGPTLANMNTASESDEAGMTATTIALSLALQEVDTLSIAKDAADKGVYLGDGFNDASATEIRQMERIAERDRATLEITELRSRLAALDTRIGNERRRTDLLAAASLAAPSNGVLWEVLVSDGEIVLRGQDVMKLMNCGSALVTLSVPDVVYNRLRVGQTAKFRMNGTEEIFDGTITRIAGAGAETIYRNLAIAPSLRHLERYDVALLVPGLRENTDLNCTVGQTGRVFFDSRPLDWFRSMLN